MVFFGLTSIFALVLLGTILYRMPEREWMGRLSVSAILGGAVGNRHGAEVGLGFGLQARAEMPAHDAARRVGKPLGEGYE